MGQLVYNGMDLEEDFGVVVDSSESWPKPERDRELVHVPGRNGDLIIDHGGYKNMELTYHCLIKDGWREKFGQFCDLMYSNSNGYGELFDSEHPGVYRMAEFAGGITPELWFTSDTGVFDLIFNCKPLQYVVGAVELDFRTADVTETFDNPYYMWSYPKIRVWSQSGAYLGIQNWGVKVAPQTVYDQIVIDCEAEVIYGTDDMDNYLGPASQYVTFTPPEESWQNPEDRTYPSLGYGNGIQLTATHDVWNDDMDDPQIIATYTGTATVDLNITRI